MLKKNTAAALATVWAAATLVVWGQGVWAQEQPRAKRIELIASGSVAGDLSDKSGLDGVLDDGKTPQAIFGSWGSGIVYSAKNNLYYAVSDGGPADGFKARVHAIRVLETGGVELVNTVTLKNKAGKNLVGTQSAFGGPEDDLRFDPEGIALWKGRWMIASEFGDILIFNPVSGKCVGKISVPNKFLIPKSARHADKQQELKASRGRQVGRGWEGLAVTPGGKVVAAMQNPLLQDGALDVDLVRVGLSDRILVAEPSGKTREFLYPLDAKENGVNELLAINETLFLAIERDGKAGAAAKYKKINLVDLRGATDISRIKKLPVDPVNAPAIKPVKKSVLIDFLDPQWKIDPQNMPEKFEGLAWGPRFEDGRLRLVVTTDNDFGVRPSNDSRDGALPTLVFIFAIDPQALA